MRGARSGLSRERLRLLWGAVRPGAANAASIAGPCARRYSRGVLFPGRFSEPAVPAIVAFAAVSVCAALIVCAASTRRASAAGAETMPAFPAVVTTIDGQELDVAAMARASTVVVVTLKAHWCPVCQRQLERIKLHGERLAECGIRFVVLAPGPRDELAAIRERTGFDHPFVEDRGLRISASLGLRLGDAEIQPAILMLDRDLRVGWMQRGRSSALYGDGALVEKVACWSRMPI